MLSDGTYTGFAPDWTAIGVHPFITLDFSGTLVPCRLAILVSGRGSNMTQLLRAISAGKIDAVPVLVASDTPNAAALDTAAEFGVPTIVCAPDQFASRHDWEQSLIRTLQHANTELIALAGFMRVLSAPFIAAFDGCLLNIHPSLLPKYKGLQTHQRALDAGDTQAGCSVHFVSATLDSGPLIARAPVRIAPTDDAAALAKKVLAREHILYPRVVGWFASGRLVQQGDIACLDGQALHHPIDLS